MTVQKTPEKQRQRAPSQRALQTRARIFDAAEQLFAERGFDGASIRDIAREAGVQGALVNHHGGSKEALFHAVVERRAETLAQRRRARLEGVVQQAGLRALLAAFIDPLIELMAEDPTHWAAYARLIAHVSADPRWREISESCFDPTFRLFLQALAQSQPGTPPERLSAGLIFTVSALLALCTSQWRLEAFAAPAAPASPESYRETLLDFCEAGFANACAPARA
ncbi:TetR/AcrR family transcriptional regulator [Pseudoruegeria sp. SHC-113]|uniref:TetR/AcrR family transcriptional regulator n=1 Tax=Pseudoruegeria sp. SHC-113 TaxID=2855439 RepID=UPI0021BB3A48|nr:TetR/AcrR family transcriptional regulator [Pseudoruegeria sp. SHC-113]MCT8160037.1 TetR family transcriptional regulator [Pseudoruegeria sp. SHC-113]